MVDLLIDEGQDQQIEWKKYIMGDGNTRTIAVFVIKYLRTLGFDATNDILQKMHLISEMIWLEQSVFRWSSVVCRGRCFKKVILLQVAVVYNETVNE